MSNFGTTDFYLEVSKGNVDGHSGVIKFGENPASGLNVWEDVWDGGGTYTPPTTSRIHNLASTAAGDTGLLVSSGTATGGSTTTLVDTGANFVGDAVAIDDYILNDTGMYIGPVSAITATELTIAAGMREPSNAVNGKSNIAGDAYRVVRNASTGVTFAWVSGLNEVLQQVSEFILLNGVTDVPTVLTYYRQFRMRVFANRFTGITEADGDVTSTAAVDATVSCQVLQGNNQTLMAFYTVPIDKTAYVTHLWAALSGSNTADASIQLRRGDKLGMGYVLHTNNLNKTGNSSMDIVPTFPVKVGGGIDIWVRAMADANNTPISAGFDILLVDE